LFGDVARNYAMADGKLSDLAPTLLPFLGIAQPPEMSGHSLLRPSAPRASQPTLGSRGDAA
jgi:hypothetical protein